MKELMELLEKRQGNKSNEQFANEIGFRGSTMWRYKNGKTGINNQKREMMIRYFSERGDTVMVGALLVYKTGSKFTEQELDELGRLFLTRRQPAMALAPSR